MAATDKLPPSPLPHNVTAADQLLLDLFDGQPNALYKPFEQWVTTSKPFMAFAQTYQRKIRKKIRMSRDVEETYNLYCELRTAYLLLQEPRFAVAYEPYGKQQGRSADLAVTFKTRTAFHVEITRLRVSQHEQQLYQREEAPEESGIEDQIDFIRRYESRRLVDVVCDKFEQLSPDTPNILWVWSESRVIHELDIGQVMRDLKRRAEQRDADLFARYGFGKPADLIRYYQRVSAILVQSLHEQRPHRAPIWWQNNDTRHPYPSKVANLLHALITADTSQSFTASYGEDCSLLTEDG
jgi:hypothetical protein